MNPPADADGFEDLLPGLAGWLDAIVGGISGTAPDSAEPGSSRVTRDSGTRGSGEHAPGDGSASARGASASEDPARAGGDARPHTAEAPRPSASTSPAAAGGQDLPRTGASLAGLGAGLGFLVLGAGLVLVTRRRR